MQAFTTHRGIVVPMDRANVDTDAILPKQFMKSIERTGFGPHLFDGLRYIDLGEPGMDLHTRRPNPDFVLNLPRYAAASVLLARRNFGCGSSREHAPWALWGYGIRVLIAPSFADIFSQNCVKNGLLAVELSESTVDRLFDEVAAQPGYQLEADLNAQVITTPSGETIPFAMDPARRETLLDGLDEIGQTLKQKDLILAFEDQHQKAYPWLFENRFSATEPG